MKNIISMLLPVVTKYQKCYRIAFSIDLREILKGLTRFQVDCCYAVLNRFDIIRNGKLELFNDVF